jgi:RNA polymerase sigma-54 factor
MVNKNPYLRQSLRIAPIQKLTLTPALLQKIELLTLPHLELSEFIKNELLENPFLDEAADASEAPPADEPTPAVASEAEEAEELGRGSFDDVELDSFFQEYLSPGYKTAEYEHYERPEYDTFAVRPVSLYEHLNWQLNLVDLRPEVERAAREVIGNLSEDGYLQVSHEELAETAGVTPADAAEAVAVIQRFDPPGLAARDLRECLLVQLRYWDQQDSLAYRILERHADLLEAGQLDGIAELEGCPAADVQAAMDRIRHLNPKPGLQYQPDSTIYIQPDVYILKVGNNYVITLNEDGLPRLHINTYYRRILEGGDANREDKRFIRDKFRSAVELIRNLDHRRRTIYRVCEIIIERQRDFLDNGIAHLRPMLLKDVAERLGLHTSTVSRAVTGKWVHCPQGILELRQFFTLGFKTDTGDDISVHILKDKIRDLIAKENPANPLSDNDLTDILNRDGIEIKRRTVAKYREEMEIPNSRSRRRKT